jgi:mRNA interferase MazF
MKRGDVVIVAIAGDYGKPRPAVVVQADRFLDDFESILVCPMTSDATPHSVARIPVPHSPQTGLLTQSPDHD